jgi:hypothetical protein
MKIPGANASGILLSTTRKIEQDLKQVLGTASLACADCSLPDLSLPDHRCLLSPLAVGLILPGG